MNYLKALLLKLENYIQEKRRARIIATDPYRFQHYVGSAFKDSLYYSDSSHRERSAIWKLVRFPEAEALCNSTWKWFAVNIPLRLVDKTQPDGDIDIIVHMLTSPTPTKPQWTWKSVYRAFEVKTILVDQSGQIQTSLKESKFHKILGQLDKLSNFGAQQLFLLEAYIYQAGYSDMKKEVMPQDALEAARRKFQRIVGKDYGYEIFLLEQIPGFDEFKTGVFHPNISVQGAKISDMNAPFKAIIEEIENFFSKQNNAGYLIGYCTNCRALTMAGHEPAPTCSTCHRDLRTGN